MVAPTVSVITTPPDNTRPVQLFSAVLGHNPVSS